jgi:hypothetical protein
MKFPEIPMSMSQQGVKAQSSRPQKRPELLVSQEDTNAVESVHTHAAMAVQKKGRETLF